MNYMTLPRAKTKDGEEITLGKHKFVINSNGDTPSSNPQKAIEALKAGLKAGLFSELTNAENGKETYESQK
jgi:hypothetical protein